MNKNSGHQMLRNNFDLMLDFYGMVFDGEVINRSESYVDRYRNLNGFE